MLTRTPPKRCLARLRPAACLSGKCSRAFGRAAHIALLDAEEEETALVATSLHSSRQRRRTSPSRTPTCTGANLGLASLTNPFPDHNQAPRNTYADAMGKQGMGVPQLSWGSTLTSTNVLKTPQRPVATSHAAEAAA